MATIGERKFGLYRKMALNQGIFQKS